MKCLSEILTERNIALTIVNRQLRRDLARHARVEMVLTKRSERYATLWKESRILHHDLRRLTHQMLQAQEEQRRDLSCKLQDIIGQTLLGINIKLLAMRRGTQDAKRGIVGHIASAQKSLSTSARNALKASKSPNQL